MPGDDYYTNFRVGDPYVKVDQGFARLPGSGYAALHPELKNVDPEDYPDINKMSILADVAPYSREYNTYRLKVGKQAQGNTELQIEYEKILERVRQTKESVVRIDDRHLHLVPLSFRPAKTPRACACQARSWYVVFLLADWPSTLAQIYSDQLSSCWGDRTALEVPEKAGYICSPFLV